MQLSEAVSELLMATQANGRSARTLKDYAQKLAPLVEFLGDPDIGEIAARDLRRYVAGLRSRTSRYQGHPCRQPEPGGLSIASVAGYVRVMKLLFRFALSEGFITENPARSVRVPKPQRGEPKAISRTDFAALLAATEGNDVVNRRDRALLLLLADSAARVGGLARLRVSDVNLGQRTVYLQGKGGKGRYAFFSPLTGDALKRWLEVRPQDRGDHLFINLGSRGGDALTDQGIRQVLRRLKRKSGVEGVVNPHSFRHGFAREFLKNGGDLASLADIMGHSDVRVTWASYAVFTMEELKAAHGRYSPVVHLEQST